MSKLGTNIYPLKLKPIYKERIWGGQKLHEVFNKDIPENEKIGESWELADLPNDKSIIANGEFAGETLNAIINRYPKEIMGDENFKGSFPLLIKFLDAQDILSVQVHPDPQTCKLMSAGEPKTECWYIISAEAGAVIYKGLRLGVNKESFKKAIETGEVAELLEKVTVRAGECHFLPAGTVHAIGPGLLIAEIQTSSDTTYRVFDWNRVNDNGQPRQLHIQQALESIHFDSSKDNLAVTTIGRLADCEYFKIDKGHQVKNRDLLLSSDNPKVLIFLTGCGEIIGTSQEQTNFSAGDTILIPAEYEGVVQFKDDTEYLTVTI